MVASAEAERLTILLPMSIDEIILSESSFILSNIFAVAFPLSANPLSLIEFTVISAVSDDEKNDDIKILKIEDLIESKKVSVLELESYNSDYIKNLIIELLTKIENTNDTL